MKAKLSLLVSACLLVSIFVMTGCIEEAGENPTEMAETDQQEVVDTPAIEEPVIEEPSMEEEATGEEGEVEEILSSAPEVQAAFAEKYDKDIESITVTPTHESENHMRGAVKLGDAIGDGGIFLAAKVEGKWVIVVDGNGAYTCVEVEPYNFPADMITDCYTE